MHDTLLQAQKFLSLFFFFFLKKMEGSDDNALNGNIDTNAKKVFKSSHTLLILNNFLHLRRYFRLRMFMFLLPLIRNLITRQTSPRR